MSARVRSWSLHTPKRLMHRTCLALRDYSRARIAITRASELNNADHYRAIREYSGRSTHVFNADSSYAPCRHPCAPLSSVFAVCHDVNRLEKGSVLTWAARNGQECNVKNDLTTKSAVFRAPRKSKPSRIEEREQGAGQDRRAAHPSTRRRSARATAERGPLGGSPEKGAVLVGPNVLLREGLSRILTAAGFRILASALCADAHLLNTIRREQSILFIIDLSDDFDAGLRQILLFRERCPAGRVVVLADQPLLSGMVSAYRAGANAYLVKVTTCEAFVKSLELVSLGVTLLPPELLILISDRQSGGRNDGDHASWAADDRRESDDQNLTKSEIVEADAESGERTSGTDSSQAPRLSARERAILRCLTEGDSNKTVARKMTMTEANVKVHVKTILRKIRVRNRTQAAIWAMSNDPLTLPKDDAPLASDELPGEPLPELDIVHVLSEEYRNGSASLAAIKVNGSSDVAMPSDLGLVRKRG